MEFVLIAVAILLVGLILGVSLLVGRGRRTTRLDDDAVSGTTLTCTRPSALRSNFTCPSTRAWSECVRPTPTLRPGIILVPRWVTMMLPARTFSPPYFFTPRRLPAESRPFREEPPAFLWAIPLSPAQAVAISPMRSTVKCWRWPRFRR